MEKPMYLSLAGCLVNPAVSTAGVTVCLTNIVATACGTIAYGAI